METPCAARHTGSDQMHCAVCRLIWDVNDEDAARMCPRGVREVERPVPVRVRTRKRVGFISALAPDFIS
jgi:hypothetical protein